MADDVDINGFQQQLAELENQISQMCRSDSNLDDFYRSFLERVVAVLGRGGAIWQMSQADEFTAKCHINLAEAGLEEGGRQQQLLNVAIGRLVQTASPVVLPANDGTNLYDGGLGKSAVNDSPHSLLFVPIMVKDTVAAIFLLISPADVDPRAVRGYLGFVMGLCERAGVFLLKKQLSGQTSQLARADRLRQFVSSIHSTLDPRRACYALANYSQELLGVYRCMAGTFNSRGRFRMEAVSGLESMAVKSAFIKNIATIARHVCKNEKTLLVDNPNAAIQVDRVNDDDLITSLRLGIFPIRSQGHVVGALVVEKAVEEPFDQEQNQQIDALLTEAGSALENCLKYRHMPLALTGRALGALRDKIYRAKPIRRAVAIAVLLAVVTMPFVIQRQVRVKASAELIPSAMHFVYAQVPGVIKSVSVPEDGLVTSGDTLATMDMRIIDSEIDRVTNAIGEADLGRTNARTDNKETIAEQYRFELLALQAELEKHKLLRDRHKIYAPVTGKVTTSAADRRKLLSKPVTPGELIFEVVPDQPEWEFIVNVPEDEAGQLLKAYKKLKPNEHLSAKLILKSYPEKTFSTKVLSIAPRASVLTTGQQKYRNIISVRLAKPDDKSFDRIDIRQGMEGSAAIECGRRSLFYALTHEFVDYIRVSLF